MNADPANLPDDTEKLKEIIIPFNQELTKSQETIHYLEERVRLLQNEIFGRKSEKHRPEDLRQRPIFEHDNQQDPDQSPTADAIVIAAHKRKKRGRKPLPADLPRVDVVSDLSEEEKVCACGAQLSRIGEDTCEKLDYIPAKVRVLCLIRYKYACKCCEGVEDESDDFNGYDFWPKKRDHSPWLLGACTSQVF